MKRVLCTLAAGLAINTAHSAQWVAFTDDVHLDVHSVRTVEATTPVVSAWFKLTGEMGIHKDTPRAVTSRTKVDVNCGTEQMRTHGHYRYDKNGSVVYQESAASGWVSPPPESAGELMMGAACAAWAKLKAQGLLRD